MKSVRPLGAHALHAMTFFILLLRCLARRFHQALWVGLRLTPSQFGPDSRGSLRLSVQTHDVNRRMDRRHVGADLQLHSGRPKCSLRSNCLSSA